MSNRLFCQHTAWLHSGDAVGNFIRRLDGLASQLGMISRIAVHNIPAEGFSKTVIPARKKEFSPLRKIPVQFHVLHYAGPGYPLALFRKLPGYHLLYYHNLTPIRFFLPYATQSASTGGFITAQRQARAELVSLTTIIDLAIGVSAFNERDLLLMGFPRTAILPLMIQSPPIAKRPETEFGSEGGRPSPILGVVGRVAPNKNLELAISVLYFLKKCGLERARLVIAGNRHDFPAYLNRLRTLIDRLQLQDDIEFCGHLEPERLDNFYRDLDYYLSPSRHEGFGMTNLEAMSYGIPVIALDAGGVRETMDGAGILIREEEPHLIAELIIVLERDTQLKKRILTGQTERARRAFAYPHHTRLAEMLRMVEAGVQSDNDFQVLPKGQTGN